MDEAITCAIGDETITLPPILNFEMLERVWPAIKASAGATDSISRVAADIAIVSGVVIGARPELTVPEIKRRLRVNLADGSDQRTGLSVAVGLLLTVSGLIPAGEDQPPTEAAPAAA